MKREEAIAILQEKHDECKTFYDLAAHPEEAYPGTKEYMEALQMALAALRGPTREQVEKAFRAHWEDVYSGSGMLSKCSNCGFKALYSNVYVFCPDCGSPFTDAAVDIVMKRLEKLYEDR